VGARAPLPCPTVGSAPLELSYRFPTYIVQVAVLFVSADSFVAAEGCGCLAEGLRLGCVHHGSFAAFATVYFQFPAVNCDLNQIKSNQTIL